MSKKEPSVKARPAQSRVFSRIQSYFPSGSSTSKTTSPSIPSAQNVKVKPPQPRLLKVKIVTWNMHDSLPKGDLEELLGKVPAYNTSDPTTGQFPVFPDDDSHPYHLVVVAGQECPTLSGIPMGLGAVPFKWHDKERENSKVKEKEKGNELENSRENLKDKIVDRSKSRKDKDEVKKRKEEDPSREHDPAGWTAICEDWFCNGGGSGVRVCTPTIADVSAPKPLMRRVPSKEPKKGPYQLLVKERLMGIYMAIYIHRDIQPLVKGTSKSAVTAGLIGGRVGNKGGVGISLNIDGTTFLFLNAHLAAHGSRVNHRLANLAKIKAELTVDSYLSHDDPRMMAEDLTDRFDHTFIFGDLNFRLDITRLHADWLIAHQEYAKALHFDQLQKLMKDGKAFVGFEEGTINFPPTFKYDVLRTLKKSKRSSFRSVHSPQAESPIYTSQEQLIQDKVHQGRDDDIASLISSASRSSSVNSGDEQTEAPTISVAPIAPVDRNTSHSKIKHKARKRWKSLVSATRLQSRTYRSRRFSVAGHLLNTSRKSLEETQRPNKSKVPTPPQRHSLDNNRPLLQPPAIFINSTKTSLNNSEEQLLDKGVYDSSHKQRVPSWCDRILWKTTVQPVPEEEEAIGDTSARSKTSFKQLFAKAFRPRSRSASQDSTPFARSTKESTPTSSGPPQSAPFSRIVQPPGQVALGHSRSHESLRSHQVPNLGLTKRRSANRLRRINSANIGTLSDDPSSIKPPRHSTEGPSSRRPPSRGGMWGFLTPFFSPSSPEASTVELISPGPCQPRKGDVVCLSYKTLDDQGMRRLEGRSDHRPVMGSYAVYL